MTYYVRITDGSDGRLIDVPMIDNGDGTISFPTSFTPKPSLGKPGPVPVAGRSTVLSNYNAASVAAGASITSTPVALAGATFNDTFHVSANISLLGMKLEGVCTSAGNVAVRFVNNTGSAIDLPAGNYIITKTN